MGVIPTPYTVTVRDRQVVGRDDYGNDIVEWAEAAWPVRSISPLEMDDPQRANREESIIQWTVIGDKEAGYPRTAKAEVQLPGDDRWYSVDGTPDDWTRGPWINPAAGLIVQLRYVEG